MATIALIFGLNTRPFSQKTICLFVIVYVEMMIVSKYIFQFPFSFNALDCAPNAPFQYPWFVVVGIQQYCGDIFSPHIITELLILFVSIIHRDALRKVGLWHFNSWERGERKHVCATSSVSPVGVSCAHTTISFTAGGTRKRTKGTER